MVLCPKPVNLSKKCPAQIIFNTKPKTNIEPSAAKQNKACPCTIVNLLLVHANRCIDLNANLPLIAIKILFAIPADAGGIQLVCEILR